MNDLIAYIVAKNDETRAWLAANPGSFALMPTEDPAHWAKLGITTVEAYRREILISGFSDMYKEQYGIRPRFMAFERMTLEEIEAEYDSLAQQLLADSNREEEERLCEAVAQANMKAIAEQPLTYNPFAALGS